MSGKYIFGSENTVYYLAKNRSSWGGRALKGWSNYHIPVLPFSIKSPILSHALEGNKIRLQWIADTDVVLQVSTDAGDDWTDVEDGIQTESGSYVYKVSTIAKQAFYRLKIEME